MQNFMSRLPRPIFKIIINQMLILFDGPFIHLEMPQSVGALNAPWRWRRKTFSTQVYLRSSGKIYSEIPNYEPTSLNVWLQVYPSVGIGAKNTIGACITSWEGLTNSILASNPLPTYFSVKLSLHTHTMGYFPPHPPQTGDWFHFICTQGLFLACSELIKCCLPARPLGQ